MPVLFAKGFCSRNWAPKFFCPPDPLLPDPVTVGAAAVFDDVGVKVGSTNAVASLSQLKHAVSSAKLVPTSVIDVPKFTSGTCVSNMVGTANVALAYRPMSRVADGTMFMSFGKT